MRLIFSGYVDNFAISHSAETFMYPHNEITKMMDSLYIKCVYKILEYEDNIFCRVPRQMTKSKSL